MYIKNDELTKIEDALRLIRDWIADHELYRMYVWERKKLRQWVNVLADATIVVDGLRKQQTDYNAKQKTRMAERRKDPDVRAKHNKASRDYYHRKKK